MKSYQKYLAVLAILFSSLMYSCQKEQSSANLESAQSVSKPLETQASLKPQFVSWEPEGSKILQTENGFIVRPPDGWQYAGLDKSGKAFNLLDFAGKTISCTCNNTSGRCKPFSASGPGGTISGCGGECTNCTMKQSSSLYDVPIDIYTGGYYLASAPIKVLKNGESAPAVFDALAKLPNFQSALKKFIQIAFEGKLQQYPIRQSDGSIVPPKGHSLIGISIMGRGMVIVVPDKYALKELGYTNQAKASCSCSSGTCELKDWRLLGTGAVWCDGDCTTCTLITDSSIQNAPYSISLQSYRY